MDLTLKPQDCSACTRMLFADLPDYPARIHAVRAAGHAAVKFWGWRAKGLDGIAAALMATGLRLTGFAAALAPFLAALPDSLKVAQGRGADFLYIQGGKLVPDMSRATMTATLVSALKTIADILHGSGVTLLLKPVSDAKAGFLTRAADGLLIVAAVKRPQIGLLHDLCHAAVAGEQTADTIGSQMALFGYVHLADHPGRAAPRRGVLMLDYGLAGTWAQGDNGRFGLEYRPGAPR